MKNTKQNDQISFAVCLREEGILAISPATNERTKRISSPPTSSSSEGKKKCGARDGDDGPIRAKKRAGTPLSPSSLPSSASPLSVWKPPPVGRRRKEGSRNGGSSLSLLSVLLLWYYHTTTMPPSPSLSSSPSIPLDPSHFPYSILSLAEDGEGEREKCRLFLRSWSLQKKIKRQSGTTLNLPSTFGFSVSAK